MFLLFVMMCVPGLTSEIDNQSEYGCWGTVDIHRAPSLPSLDLQTETSFRISDNILESLRAFRTNLLHQREEMEEFESSRREALAKEEAQEYEISELKMHLAEKEKELQSEKEEIGRLESSNQQLNSLLRSQEERNYHIDTQNVLFMTQFKQAEMIKERAAIIESLEESVKGLEISCCDRNVLEENNEKFCSELSQMKMQEGLLEAKVESTNQAKEQTENKLNLFKKNTISDMQKLLKLEEKCRRAIHTGKNNVLKLEFYNTRMLKSKAEEKSLRDLYHKEVEAKQSEIATLAKAKLESEALEKQYGELKSEHAALLTGAKDHNAESDSSDAQSKESEGIELANHASEVKTEHAAANPQ